MQKPQGFFGMIIDKAHENKDLETVVQAYLFTMNYAELTLDHLIKVFESQRYDELIDHRLIKHLNEQIELRKPQNNPIINMYHAAYLMRSKGYLSAVDLIHDIAKMPADIKIPNNEHLKNELIARYLGVEGDNIDKDVIVQFKDAVKKLEGRIDAEFYGLIELFKPVEVV